MNILFFLKPKSEVAYIEDDSTLRQAMESMEYHRYTAIPMLNDKGEFAGTVTEGDILWTIKAHHDLSLKEAENIYIKDCISSRPFKVVAADAKMEDLIKTALNQNFVPVADDQNKFIGIITRKSIIEYCYKKLSDCDK